MFFNISDMHIAFMTMPKGTPTSKVDKPCDESESSESNEDSDRDEFVSKELHTCGCTQ